MKKILIILLFNFLLIYISVSQSNNRKYDLWRIPSFFRGYNILDWKPKTLKDFLDLKASGATLAQLACDGFNNALPPYDTNQKSMAETEMMVEYCRQAGLYYTIAVRKGPGREDVYYEGQGIVPKSTIWTDNYEQALYGKMLKDIVHRYKDDSLFVGLGLIVEPNPLFDSVYLNSAMLKPMLANNNINITAIMKQLIDSVRTEDPKIPVLVQNVAYSCPEFYDLMERQTDS
ncbi:MAG: cellulase family glycosylhydrolase, partial [FCB group bacterium]